MSASPLPGSPTARAARVEALLRDRGWQLAGADFFAAVESTLAQWMAAPDGARWSPDLVDKAAVHEYCKRLHACLSGTEEAPKLRALEELRTYGYPAARQMLAGEHDRLTAIHMAMVKLLSHLEPCWPESTLAYFAAILHNEIKQVRRRNLRVDAHERSEADLRREAEDDEDLLNQASRRKPQARGYIELARSSDEVERRLVWPHLRRALIVCLKSRCNALIFLHGYGFGRSTTSLAQRLNLSPTAVSLRKARARAAIQADACPTVIELLRLLVA